MGGGVVWVWVCGAWCLGGRQARGSSTPTRSQPGTANRHPPTDRHPPKVPNVKFNVARMLERMAPLTGRAVVEQQIKPALRELSEDADADVRFYAAQALYGVDQDAMVVA